ncbi:PHD finger protein 12 [Neocloeon triangulifer]|uniref:PHD finger protein 12 n=1 Tax=Neocloeon triangulifer TaxID=2078957 RepID=UPI00286F266F|nr:PHD finger protein 12 [Neocloeon triangulifer]
MEKLDYDFDACGGLMPQIQALIAPPPSEEKGRRRETKHPYYRRPGKGHNHDCCDACGEGGDLLCCDKCPASFHLLCHDPPLNEEDIPTGMWLCHNCKFNNAQNAPPITKQIEKLKRDVIESPATSKSATPISFSVTNATNETTGQLCRLFWRRDSEQDLIGPAEAKEIALGVAETVPEVEMTKVEEFVALKELVDIKLESEPLTKEPAADQDLQPLKTLIQAAAQLNPKEFELPYEFMEPITLPGTEKAMLRRGKSKRKPHELDNGLVPLPAKLCHECHKSCRLAPLLACDYCPLLFHLDCLTPPLTTVPSGRWMCPAHSNHSVDQKLLQSSGATERLRLWDQYCVAPIDPEAIKINFLRHSRISQSYHRKRLPRVKLCAKNTAKIPEAVRQHYMDPKPLVPLGGPLLTMVTPADTIPKESTKEEQDLWLMSVMALQTSIASHLHLKHKDSKSNHAKVQPVENNAQLHSNGGLCNGYLDVDMDKSQSKSFSYPSNQSRKLAALLQGNIFSGKESDLEFLDDSLIRALAMQRLQELTSGAPYMPIAKPNAQLAPCISLPLSSIYIPQNIATKAAIYPVVSCKVIKELAHCLALQQLSIGLGSNVDIDLSRYGHCNFVSSLHALIFYDNSTKEFELMNYSEHGTVIDSIFYCIEESQIEVYQPPQPNYNPRDPPLAFGARKILAARRRRWKCTNDALKEEPEKANLKSPITNYEELPDENANKEFEELRIKKRISSLQKKCNCNTKRLEKLKAQGPGWEGTAILKHGSLLKFGCLQFIFARSWPESIEENSILSTNL